MEYTWPNEFELLEFFESEPIESHPSEGFWCYEKTYEGGFRITFSFNIHERSIQTNMCLNGDLIVSICHEGAQGMTFVEEANAMLLRATFDDEGYQRELTVQIQPKYLVKWSTIAK